MHALRLRPARLPADEPPSTASSCTTQQHARSLAMASGHKLNMDAGHAQKLLFLYGPLADEAAVVGLQEAAGSRPRQGGDEEVLRGIE